MNNKSSLYKDPRYYGAAWCIVHLYQNGYSLDRATHKCTVAWVPHTTLGIHRTTHQPPLLLHIYHDTVWIITTILTPSIPVYTQTLEDNGGPPPTSRPSCIPARYLTLTTTPYWPSPYWWHVLHWRPVPRYWRLLFTLLIDIHLGLLTSVCVCVFYAVFLGMVTIVAWVIVEFLFHYIDIQTSP